MKKLFKISFAVLNITILIILIISSIYAVIVINDTPNINFYDINTSSTSIIYDNTGDKLTDISPTLNKYVPISKISQNMINATISIEDNEFYNHNGVNIKRMIGATYKNILSRSFQEGASTIEQQLIKNLYLSNEKTFSRKIKEVSIALNLNKELTKNQIMEAYLNNILFGGNIYGIEVASNYYFNKPASELSVNEAAILAGIIQLPNYYNPFKNVEATTSRRNLVLDFMFKLNYITQKELEENKKIDINLLLNKGNNISSDKYYSSYVDYTYSYLTDNDLTLSNTDYFVSTYMNKSVQKELYDIVNNKYNYFPDDDLKCAIVVLDNTTGGVLGLIGNKSSDQRVLNYALTKMQPGSTIKPLIDYAPAIEYLNYTPSTIILDNEFTYSNGTKLKNWDNSYKGYITMRQALSESRNIPAVKTFLEVGEENALEFLKRLNLDPGTKIYESEAIGGSKYGYSLLELTNAYMAFANMGKYTAASPIKEIKSESYTYQNDETLRQVMKDSTAYLINSMLHDVFKNSSFNLNYTYLCAKTGQTNYPSDIIEKYNIPTNATKDALLIAYTKDLTIGIYLSYDKYSSTTYLNTAKVGITKTIMKHLFDKFAKSNMYYEIPKDIITKQIIKDYDTIYLASLDNYNSSYLEYFIIGTEPIYYKNKNDYYET